MHCYDKLYSNCIVKWGEGMKEEKFFTAGQFARLHNLNKRTLQYYDEIGLFSPRHRDSKGYRYYARSQSAMLELILGFRELGLSIEEIKSKMHEGTVDNYIALFSDYQHDIDAYIARLQTMKHSLRARQRLLERSKGNLNQIEIINEETTYLFTRAYEEKLSYDENFQALAKNYHEMTGDRIFRWPMGAMLSITDAKNQNYYHYSHLFLENDDATCCMFVRKGGPFLVGYSLGYDKNLQTTYQRLFDYATTHHLLLGDVCYEIGLNDELYISEMVDSINQILIPIEA